MSVEVTGQCAGVGALFLLCVSCNQTHIVRLGSKHLKHWPISLVQHHHCWLLLAQDEPPVPGTTLMLPCFMSKSLEVGVRTWEVNCFLLGQLLSGHNPKLHLYNSKYSMCTNHIWVYMYVCLSINCVCMRERERSQKDRESRVATIDKKACSSFQSNGVPQQPAIGN